MKCKYCNTEIDWNGSDYYKGHIYQCENDNCECYFCTKCCEDKLGASIIKSMDKVLCPECYTKNKFGIDLLDSIVIGDNRFISLKEKGLM